MNNKKVNNKEVNHNKLIYLNKYIMWSFLNSVQNYFYPTIKSKIEKPDYKLMAQKLEEHEFSDEDIEVIKVNNEVKKEVNEILDEIIDEIVDKNEIEKMLQIIVDNVCQNIEKSSNYKDVGVQVNITTKFDKETQTVNTNNNVNKTMLNNFMNPNKRLRFSLGSSFVTPIGKKTYYDKLVEDRNKNDDIKKDDIQIEDVESFEDEESKLHVSKGKKLDINKFKTLKVDVESPLDNRYFNRSQSLELYKLTKEYSLEDEFSMRILNDQNELKCGKMSWNTFKDKYDDLHKHIKHNSLLKNGYKVNDYMLENDKMDKYCCYTSFELHKFVGSHVFCEKCGRHKFRHASC